MISGLRERPLQNTKGGLIKDESGFAQSVIGLFLILFMIVVIVFVLNVGAYKSLSDKLEDALAESSLAASVIDIERYGTDHSLIISDVAGAYQKYLDTLKINLNLTGNTPSGEFFGGDITIEDFRIYNCVKDSVTEVCVKDGTVYAKNKGIIGEMRAPNGQVVVNTGIYSEISFPINDKLLVIGGFRINKPGTALIARKNKLTTVKRR
ncbi:MAG: hypothetical protein K5669_03420 [Lachnospiraceae bacterium]|nr:hypothetical protein [Lachnospiraceae bacterium]